MHRDRKRFGNVMLRFRRWARHSYSVFCSIGKKVTIGHLSSDIVDASLRKDRSIHSGYLSGDVRSISYMVFSGSDIGADETPPGGDEPLLRYLLLSMVTAVSESSESDCTEARRFSEIRHSYTSYTRISHTCNSRAGCHLGGLSFFVVSI